MPDYETDGTANLRAEPHVYAGGGANSPSGGGKDAGGTENLGTTTETKQAGTKSPSTSNKNAWPSGVQTFSDQGT